MITIPTNENIGRLKEEGSVKRLTIGLALADLSLKIGSLESAFCRLKDHTQSLRTSPPEPMQEGNNSACTKLSDDAHALSSIQDLSYRVETLHNELSQLISEFDC